jgi:hypothetical protein
VLSGKGSILPENKLAVVEISINARREFSNRDEYAQHVIAGAPGSDFKPKRRPGFQQWVNAY